MRTTSPTSNHTETTTETNSIRGGTAIYINDKYDSFERHALKIREEDFEAVWIEIKNKHGKNTVCGCIYHHPRYDMVNFLNYIDKVLNILYTKNKEIHISGDFNTDFLKLESNNSYQESYNLITSCGLLQQILLPTRVTANSATVIDNVFTNTLRIGSISGNLLFSISDHFAQFFSINKNNISFKKVEIYERNYKTCNTQAFGNDISLLEWNTDTNDVNQSYSDFISKLGSCVDIHAPIKRLNKKVKLKSKPWITTHIYMQIN